MKRTVCVCLALLAAVLLRTPALAAQSDGTEGEAAGEPVSTQSPAPSPTPSASDDPGPAGTLKSADAKADAPAPVPKATSSPSATVLKEIDGKYYYLHTGWQTTAPGRVRYFDPDQGGAMVSGFRQIDGAWYDLLGGYLHTGWQTIVSGELRYFDPDQGGAMLTGLQKIDGKTYYLPDGVLCTGWQTDDEGVTRYFDPENGGAMVSGLKKIDGRSYYLPAGKLFTGWYVSQTGAARYFDPNKAGAMATSPHFAGDDMYLFASNGMLVTDQDQTLLGKTYHVNESGVIEGYMTDAMWLAKEWLDEANVWNLWTAYTLAASIPYSNRSLRAPEGQVHTEWYACYGFTNETGNCYVMNAMLYQMAKLLGYEVYFLEGYVAGAETNSPHGWCEIVEDGETYVYDSNFLNEKGRNGFRIQYGAPKTWMYTSWHRVD